MEITIAVEDKRKDTSAILPSLDILEKYVICLNSCWELPKINIVEGELGPNDFALVYLDNADVANALGYHDVTPSGMPLSKVFCQTSTNNGEQISVTATHELAEMLLDPYISLCAFNRNNGATYALEICDAVEEDTFLIDNVPVSNFLTPAWFSNQRTHFGAHFDYMKVLAAPFQLNKGGYSSVYYPQKGWTEIFGSAEKRGRFWHEDRRGHRSKIREYGEVQFSTYKTI